MTVSTIMSSTHERVLWLTLLALKILFASSQWCVPKLFEAKVWNLEITHTDDGPGVLERISTISLDVTGQRLASHETGTRNGQEYTVFNLFYYPAGTLFTVQNGVCSTSTITGNISSLCIDYYEKHVIDRLMVEFLGFATSGEMTLITGAITYQDGIGALLTSDGYQGVPLILGKNGVIDGVPTHSVSSYLNVTVGIKDPSVFTPPDICIKTQVSAPWPS